MAWPGADWSRGDILAFLTLAVTCIGVVAAILAVPSLQRFLSRRAAAPDRTPLRRIRGRKTAPRPADATSHPWSRGDLIALTGALVAVVGVVAAILAIPGMPRLLPWDKQPEPKPPIHDGGKADIQPIPPARTVPTASRTPSEKPVRSSPTPQTFYTVKVMHRADLGRGSWLLDNKPAEPFIVSHDLNVTELRLPAGVHHAVAKVEGRECQSSFTVPVQGPVFLDCVDSDSGRSR